MVFSRDWDNAAPIDHTLISQGPAKIRNVRSDIEDRLSAIVSGFVSGETDKGILSLPFIAQSTPSVITDQIQLYAKAVAGKTELHGLDEDGVEHQYTTGGKLNAAELKGVYPTPAAVADLVNLLPYIYPIGTVLTFGVSTNPATLFGFGTWTAIEGKVIVGIDAGQTEFDTLDETGGEKTHTLTTAEMPSHTHAFGLATSGATGTFMTTPGSVRGSEITLDNTGGGGAHNNLQPYIVKYVWQRVS